MNLFELFVKIGVDDQASGKLSNLSSKLGNGLKTAAKIGTAAVGAAAAGITALTKAAVDNYAEYEQLVGGVETLFGVGGKSIEEYAASVGKSVEDVKSEYRSLEFAQQSVMNGAADAYKTAGLSANEYMSTVTSFSAALISSLEGDTNTAAELADRAIVAMSDNANKMGTSMEMIQNAYQGFAKQNYTMLDNLKLGYGGTKTEMQRLIDDANRVREANGEMANLSIESFADIVVAIETMQDKMGISGTTAREAGTTIEGSVNAMKSAWTNLVTGFADGSADIGGLIDNLVTTIVGDGTENNLGVIGNVLPAVERALNGIGNLIEGAIPVLIERLPGLLQQILPVLLSSATSLVNSVIEVLPELVDLIVDTLIDNAPMLIVAAVELILALAGGLIQAVPKLLKAIPTIIKETVDGFKNSENIKKFIDVGKNIIDGIKSGIKNAWNNLVSWFKGLFGDLIGIAKKILGIASPSKAFKKIGAWSAEGFGIGWADEFADVTKDIENSLNFGGHDYEVAYEGDGSIGGMFSGAGGAGGVTVVQNIYSEAKTAADLMQEAIYQQERAVLLGV